MITGISIENFKGIRERVNIELKPITLLFGANSAGKSSVLHAILYASEVFERRNLDADSTVAGGESVNLGGFKNFIHGHDMDRTVWLRFDLSNEEDYHEALSYREMSAVNEHFRIQEFFNCNADSFFDPGEISIEIGIQWSDFEDKPYVATYRLYARSPHRARILTGEVCDLDWQLLAEVSADPSGKRVELTQLDLNHPALLSINAWDMRVDAEDQQSLPPLSEFAHDLNESLISLCLRECGHCFQSISSKAHGQFKSPAILLLGQVDALPTLGKSFQPALRNKYDLDRQNLDEDEFERTYSMAKEVAEELSVILSKPLELATHYLQSSRYLGPIREVPSRDFRPAKSTDAAAARGRSKWASGRGAWEELARDKKLIDATNHWLSDRLEAGYLIEHFDYREINSLIVNMWSERAFDAENLDIQVDAYPRNTRLIIRPKSSEISLEPSDVGIGISQVVPVIVTAVSGETGLQMIEQPELHLHPRLQAELADLFVSSFFPTDLQEFNRIYDSLDDEAKQSHPNHSLQYFLIETHSEHLILRLLRRIRETEKGIEGLHRPLRTHDVAVNYLRQNNGASEVMQIDVDTNGAFIQPWPDDFFEIDFYERFP